MTDLARECIKTFYTGYVSLDQVNKSHDIILKKRITIIYEQICKIYMKPLVCCIYYSIIR